jgi:phosphoenolpyruvate carboxylase
MKKKSLEAQAPPITLEQFCRALTAHAMLTAHPNELQKFTAPEITEQVAQIIIEFAQGQRIGRPIIEEDDS